MAVSISPGSWRWRRRGLGLVSYLCSFAPSALFGPISFGLPLFLGAGLVAAATLLPSGRRMLVPAAVLAAVGALGLLGTVMSDFPGPPPPLGVGEGTSGVVIAVLVLGFLQTGALVAAVLLDSGLITPEAVGGRPSRRRAAQPPAPQGQYPAGQHPAPSGQYQYPPGRYGPGPQEPPGDYGTQGSPPTAQYGQPAPPQAHGQAPPQGPIRPGPTAVPGPAGPTRSAVAGPVRPAGTTAGPVRSFAAATPAGVARSLRPVRTATSRQQRPGHQPFQSP